MKPPAQASRVVVEIVGVTAAGLVFQKRMPVPAGQTLGWVVNASGLYALHPALRQAPLTVWGQSQPAEALVAAGDRIEVCAQVDPAVVTAHRSRLRKRKESAKVRP